MCGGNALILQTVPFWNLQYAWEAILVFSQYTFSLILICSIHYTEIRRGVKISVQNEIMYVIVGVYRVRWVIMRGGMNREVTISSLFRRKKAASKSGVVKVGGCITPSTVQNKIKTIGIIQI